MMSWLNYRKLAGSLLICLLSSSLSLWAGAKKTVTAGQMVDSGTFVVYVNGKRIASEKFEFTQSAEMNVAKAELKLDESKDAQFAELQMSPNGNLVRYQWSEKDKGTATVEPKDEFLIERVQTTQPTKTAEQPFILPSSTMILDDYFFSHRQLLLWRYLAAQCQPKPGDRNCQLPKTQYGVIVPRQQISSQVTVEYAGIQKVPIKGVDQELNRFELHMEGNDWTVWMDQAYKIQKIAIEADHAEIFRD
jgi:hypothetical protein